MDGRYPRADSGLRATGSTLRDFIAPVFRRHRLAAMSFLGIFLGAIISTLLLPKQYQAGMKILVKRERVDPMVTPESTAQPSIGLTVTEEELYSEVELLRSRDLLEKVVVTCRLHVPATNPLWASLFLTTEASSKSEAAGIDLRIPEAVRGLEKRLRVEPLKKSNLIGVTYESPDPHLAAQVLDTLANLYLDKHVAVHRPAGAFDFFQKETELSRNQVAATEARLASFSREQGVVSAELEKEITLRKLSDFESSWNETQAALAGAKERIRALEAEAAALPARQTTQLRTWDNPGLLQQLNSTLLTLELRRTELLTKFEPHYRLVREVDSQIAQTRATIAAAEEAPLREETTDRDPTFELLRAELARARSELASLHARASTTSQIVRAYRERARELDAKGMRQQDLMRDAKAAEDHYLLYLHKREESRISDALDEKRIVNVAIAEAATVPPFPSRPSWGWNLLLGGSLAILVSVVLAFAADYFDPSFRTADEIEDYLNVPVFAAMPRSAR